MEEMITRRLVEMTFAPLDEVAAWLARLGLDVQGREEGVVTVRNPHLDVATAIPAGADPVTRAVCLGFALAGAYWTGLCPRLLDEVNKEWRRRNRQAAAPKKDAITGSQSGTETGKSPPSPMAAPTFADLYKNRDPGR